MKYSIFLLLLMFSLTYSKSLAQNTPDHIVYFAVDSYSLSANEQQRLEVFVRTTLSDTTGLRLKFVGHTDADASNEYNATLSQNRVKTVQRSFEKYGIRNPIEATWLGEDQPLNTNGTQEEKRMNRRVEIFLERTTPKDPSTIRDLYKQLEQKKQVHCIDPTRDTVLVFDQGTIVSIPAYAFQNPSRNCVEVRVKEFYKKSDMILENLSTTSNGRLLESEGMIYIEAVANDQQIGLAPGKSLTVLMPTDSLRSDINLFYGQRDEHTDMMNWLQANGDRISGLNPIGAALCTGYSATVDLDPCKRCTFFFCRIQRIGKGFKGIVNQKQHRENKDLRDCQRSYRKGNPISKRTTTPLQDSLRQRQIDECAKLDSLFKAYGVTNRNDLVLAMNKDLLDKYGVKTLEELRDTLNKLKMLEIERGLVEGSGTKSELAYYVFNTAKLGWINMDAFSKLPGERITMKTELKVDEQSDCKAVFKKVKGILPAHANGQNFEFQQVPNNHPILLIGLRYSFGKAYLSMVDTKSNPQAAPFEFKEMTVQEIRDAMSQLD